jgi:hypothetical protein
MPIIVNNTKTISAATMTDPLSSLRIEVFGCILVSFPPVVIGPALRF